MTRLFTVAYVTLLCILCPIYSQANISLPAFGNRSYVSKAATVNATWTYNFTGFTVGYVEWFFRPSDQSVFTPLANTAGGKINKGSGASTNMKFNLPATMVIDNVKLDNKGTYRLSVSVVTLLSPLISQIEVIVLVQPTAAVSCPSNVIINEGDNFSCFCNGTSGNPPPSATWAKNDQVINGSGYLTKELLLKNATKNISGNYNCTVRSHNLTDSKFIELLVKSRPTAKTNCSAATTADEGQSIFCLCEAKRGNSTPDASWFNAADESLMTRTLSLENVQRQDRGKYICKANSLDLEDKTSVQVLVRFKPEINNFSSDAFHNRAEAGSTVKISCRAGGYPDANVSIYNRGNVLTTACAAPGVYTISSVKSTDAGEYKCVAKNSLGTAEKRLNITVSASTANNLTTPGNGKSTTGIEWYIALVALLVGILVGITSVFAVMRLRRRLNDREDGASTSPQGAVSSGGRPEGSHNAVYQELDLKKMNEGDNYQSLRTNFRNAKNDQGVDENEGGYQELNRIRERGDENYQSLNRV